MRLGQGASAGGAGIGRVIVVVLTLAATASVQMPHPVKDIGPGATVPGSRVPTTAPGAAVRPAVAKRPVVPTAGEEPHAGLTRDEWSQIRSAVRESEYHASPVAKAGEPSAFQAPNRQQRYRTTFRREGIEIVPQSAVGASWRLGVSVTGYGYGGEVQPLPPGEPRAEKERVEYRRGPVTEWYVNRPAGLEQGFELAEPEARRSGPLVVAMAVEGDLDVVSDGDGVSFADRSRGTLVRYAGLKAWDADHRPVPSRLETEGREIRLFVEAQRARFPITVDPTFVQEAQLFGHGDPIGRLDAHFGYSVSVSGDTAVVGAPLEDAIGDNEVGAAYVFVRSANAWVQQQRLLALDPASGDFFGWSVAVDGDTAVIGAQTDDTSGGADAGSAYVFVRSGTTWTQQKKLLASDASASDSFGRSVSVSGDTAVVGSWRDDTDGALDTGSAYVFVRAGMIWAQQQKLLASDAMAYASFGESVSISGDTVMAGASADVTAGVEVGSAYVFVRTGTTWTQQQKLLASDAAAYDSFGWSVSVSGDTAVVGAWRDDTDGGLDTGSAYVFVRTGTVWTQQQQLLASDGVAYDGLGFSVSISGETVVGGAPFRDPLAGLNAGSAHVFSRTGTTWTQQQELLSSDAMADELFGFSVSVSGDTVVVGAPSDDTVGGFEAGSAYVFVRTGTTWTQQQKLLASDGMGSDSFGRSVSISSDTVVVGAPFDDTLGVLNAGSAYVFVRTGTAWTQQQKLLALDAEQYDSLGFSVSVHGDTAVIGAANDETAAGVYAGSAYVFVRSGTTWTQQQKLLASDAAANDFFGDSVSVFADTAVVGAYRDDTADGVDAGSAYVFVRSGTTWTQQQKLLAPDAAANDLFGNAVSVFADTAVVGAYHDETSAGPKAGSAYVFVRSGTSWSQQQKLVATDATAGDWFGFSVSASADAAAIGAIGDSDAAWNAGSAYVFVRTGTTWTQQQKLVGSDTELADQFGYAVAISGDTASVGAPHDNTPDNLNAGSAYAFRLQPLADVGVTKTDGQGTAVPGQPIAYTIVVSNAGPDTANAVTVSDTPPATITDVSWTCLGSGGGTCTAIGSGSINDIVNLPSGGSVTYTLSGTVSPSATGSLANTTSVAAPAGVTDPNPGNNSATDTDTLTPEADLSITKSDGLGSAFPGQAITYTIVATNAGPSAAPNTTVTDAVPAALTGASWTCVGSGGGTCTASGSGNIIDTVNLPVGASVTYTLSGTISPSATGSLSNTASVAPSGGVTDPVPGNNSATDTDPLIGCGSEIVAVPDGRLTQSTVAAGASVWVGASLRIGNSYSVEFKNTTGTTPPGTLTVFSGDDTCSGPNTLTTTDTTAIDPPGNQGAARQSFTATGTLSYFRARLTNNTGGPVTFTFSWSDTTMFSPAWSNNGSFDTFYSFQNTTGTTLHGALTLLSPTGTMVISHNLTIAPGQTASTNTQALGIAANQTGTARFVHDGPPGTIVAEAAIANFSISPAYVQPVKFQAMREGR